MTASPPPTLFGRLRQAALAALGRPRAPRYWRAVHGVVGSRAVVSATAAVLRSLGGGRAEGVLTRFWQLVVLGWPVRGPAWVNLDTARFTWRVRRRLAGAPAQRPRRPVRVSHPLRVACISEFRRLTSYGTPVLFDVALADTEVHVLDIEYRGDGAGYLAPLVTGYRSYADIASVARDANRLEPDLVIHFSGLSAPVYDLVDQLDAPCVVHVCTGTIPLFHEGVDFQFHAQPEAEYFARDGRLFSGLARAPSGGERLVVGGAFFDPAGLDGAAAPPLRERQAKVVVHGSLYKVAQPAFLEVLAALLGEDAQLDLVLMGRDDGNDLPRIQRALGPRVSYEGSFLPHRGPSGHVEDPGRGRMLAHLRTARLAPNPFPMGGGSSRAEAYGSGTPSIHLGLRTDPASWGRPQVATVDAPLLNVDEATAFAQEEYLELCRRCLYDDEFATRVVAAQHQVFERLTDPTRWWSEVLGAYRAWAERHT